MVVSAAAVHSVSAAGNLPVTVKIAPIRRGYFSSKKNYSLSTSADPAVSPTALMAITTITMSSSTIVKPRFVPLINSSPAE